MVSPYVKKPLTPEVMMEVLPTLLQHKPRMKDSVICDFCGGDDPIYVYSSERMSTGVVRPCWRWCACKICSTAIDQDNWQFIEDRLEPLVTQMFMARIALLPNDGRFQPLPEVITRGVIVMSVRQALNEFRQWATRIKT